MAPVLPHHRHDDAELARRVAAGDGAAFAALDGRHRAALIRYAGSLVRRSEHDAEDIVQDVLISVHEQLRAGNPPDELRSWLYRLTRNRAINVVRRARWGDESLESETLGSRDDREEPDAVLRRKTALRHLVDDLADLPVRQRNALLAREVDGQSPEQVATQLGVSVAAAQMLATRARENLIKTREARDADCVDMRHVLLEARERGARPTEHALRHVKACDPCRAYQRDIRRLSRQLQALNPSFGLPLLAGLVKLAGGGGGKIALGAGAALVIATTGGVLVTAAKKHDAGDPAPFRFGGIKTGGSIPKGVALVGVRVQMPAGAPPRGERRSVTLTCPRRMKYAGPVDDTEQRADVQWNPAGDPIPGYSSRARIEFSNRALPRAYAVDVAIKCIMPAANGSIVRNPRLPKRGERAGRICVNSDYLKQSPGRIPVGYVYRNQPLSILRRSASGSWTRVVLDSGFGGWVRTNALCR